MLSVSLPQL